MRELFVEANFCIHKCFHNRHIGVTQVHPDDMMKFLEQCRMRLRPGTRVLDDLPANAGDISDLSLETGKCERQGADIFLYWIMFLLFDTLWYVLECWWA